MKFTRIAVALAEVVVAAAQANSSTQYTASADVGSTTSDAFPPIGSKFTEQLSL